MIGADMFYQIDMRLQELKERKNVPFGGVSVFLFGDILQIKPVRSDFLFSKPKYHLFSNSYLILPMWDMFEKRFLTFNHRQGDDLIYSEILNKIRLCDGREGEIDQDHLDILKDRVFDRNDPQIPTDALYLTARNSEVNLINEQRLSVISGDIIELKAIVMTGKSLNTKPRINWNTGEVWNTPLQANLKLKIGAKVMLTYNVDTCDGLTNGARGELIGCETHVIDEKVRVRRLYVHFVEERMGREKRKACHSTPYLSNLQKMFPHKNPTPVDRLEFKFSNSSDGKSCDNTAINFPLRLCFATTSHKIQGQTVRKPNKLVVDLKNVFQAALSYVMLSRVESLDQIFIIDDVYPRKIYPDKVAKSEFLKMSESLVAENKEQAYLNILSLNIRSLSKHLPDLILEQNIRDRDLILLQQTCLPADQVDTSKFDIEDFQCEFNSVGNGGGLAVYFRDSFHHVKNITKKMHQLTKVTSSELDVICVYISPQSKSQYCQLTFLRDLQSILDSRKKTVIVGDFNIESVDSVIGKEMRNWNFNQLITYPTHIDGNILDHCYTSDQISVKSVKIQQEPVYYSDHDKIEISLH